MKTRIGKYNILEDNDFLKVRYVYTFSDIVGGMFYALGLSLGVLILYVAFRKFAFKQIYELNFLVLSVVGCFLSLWNTYLLALGIFNPRNGILKIDKLNQTLIIKDFLKTEIIDLREISSFYLEFISNYRPRKKFGIFCIRLKDGSQRKCFIVRSSIPIDLGRKVDKDILITFRKIRDLISTWILKQTTTL